MRESAHGIAADTQSNVRWSESRASGRTCRLLRRPAVRKVCPCPRRLETTHACISGSAPFFPHSLNRLPIFPRESLRARGMYHDDFARPPVCMQAYRCKLKCEEHHAHAMIQVSPPSTLRQGGGATITVPFNLWTSLDDINGEALHAGSVVVVVVNDACSAGPRLLHDLVSVDGGKRGLARDASERQVRRSL